MKIEYKKNIEAVEFRDLNIGDCFVTPEVVSTVCMKIPPVKADFGAGLTSDEYRAVILEDGELVRVTDNAMVVRVDCKLIVE